MLDGLKTKIAGVGLALTGLGTALVSLTAEGGVNLEAAREGLLVFLGGLGAFGLAHKFEKLTELLKKL